MNVLCLSAGSLVKKLKYQVKRVSVVYVFYDVTEMCSYIWFHTIFVSMLSYIDKVANT